MLRIGFHLFFLWMSSRTIFRLFNEIRRQNFKKYTDEPLAGPAEGWLFCDILPVFENEF